MRDEPVATAEKIIADMDAAFANRDLEALSALFTEDATPESFLAARILNKPEGVCRGKREIREVLRELVEHGVPWGSHAPPLVRGNMAAVEFKTASSDCDTFSVDVLEIANGKIKSLRAYAGWRAMPVRTQTSPTVETPGARRHMGQSRVRPCGVSDAGSETAVCVRGSRRFNGRSESGRASTRESRR